MAFSAPCGDEKAILKAISPQQAAILPLKIFEYTLCVTPVTLKNTAGCAAFSEEDEGIGKLL